MTEGTSRLHGRAAAFTLVELIVSLSILVFLVGIVATLATSLARQAENRRTEDLLLLLDNAMTEWEALADRQLTWGLDGFAADGAPLPGAVYDVQKSRFEEEEMFIITQMLSVIARPSPINARLRGFPAEAVYRYRDGEVPPWIGTYAGQYVMQHFLGELTVLDAWGIPIYATHPGAPAPPGRFADPDDTERTDNENTYGVAINRRICFVSAGPDRRFGDASADHDSPEFAQTQDNLHAYPPGAPD